jgi:predicted ester cyclase
MDALMEEVRETTMTIATTTGRATMEAYLSALVSRGPFADYFTADIVLQMLPDVPEVKGRDAVEAFIRGAHEQAFDAHPEIKRLIVEDDQAAVEAVFIGRHIGEFAGIPATGKEVRVPYTAFYGLEDGQINSLRLYGLGPVAEQLKG